MKNIYSDLLEECSEAAHNEWMREKIRRGVTTWPNERGYEQLVPYSELSEDVKEFDRIVVGAIMKILSTKGLVYNNRYSSYHPNSKGPPISAWIFMTLAALLAFGIFYMWLMHY